MRNWIKIGDYLIPKNDITRVRAKTGPEHVSGYYGVYVTYGASEYPVPGTYPSLEEAWDAAENFIADNL
jgi:hypothetical protein